MLNNLDIIKEFVDNYCVKGDDYEITVTDFIFSINKILNTSFSNRGPFARAMDEFLLSNNFITKKKKSRKNVYCGIKLSPNIPIESVKLPSYEAHCPGEILYNIKIVNRSLLNIATEYKRAAETDKIQSIIHCFPNYEPLYDDDGILICPIKESDLPIIYDRRLDMKQLCKEGVKLIRKLDDLKKKLTETPHTQTIEIPQLDSWVFDIIKDGSNVSKNFERETKEYLRKLESYN